MEQLLLLLPLLLLLLVGVVTGVVDGAMGDATGDDGDDGAVGIVLPPVHPHSVANFGNKSQSLDGTDPPAANVSIYYCTKNEP